VVFPPAVYSRIHNTILCTYTQTGAFITLSSSSTVHTGSYISKKEGPEIWEIEIDKWTGSASFPAWLEWVKLIFADS
jgi:hypothetical protein